MSKTETKDVIVFTNKEELDTYNEMLLNGFMKYLSNRQKKNHDVVHVGAKVLLMQDEDFVKDFLTNLKIAEKTKNKEENFIKDGNHMILITAIQEDRKRRINNRKKISIKNKEYKYD